MTGLDPDTDSIIEIYCLITDGQLECVDESGWGTVIHQTSERMAMMDEWCTRVRMSSSQVPICFAGTKRAGHILTMADGESGLTAAVVESTETAQQAAEGLLAYIQKHVPERRVALL